MIFKVYIYSEVQTRCQKDLMHEIAVCLSKRLRYARYVKQTLYRIIVERTTSSLHKSTQNFTMEGVTMKRLKKQDRKMENRE